MTTRKNFPSRIKERQESAAARQEERANRSDQEQLARIPEHCREAERLRNRIEAE